MKSRCQHILFLRLHDDNCWMFTKLKLLCALLILYPLLEAYGRQFKCKFSSSFDKELLQPSCIVSHFEFKKCKKVAFWNCKTSFCSISFIGFVDISVTSNIHEWIPIFYKIFEKNHICIFLQLLKSKLSHSELCSRCHFFEVLSQNEIKRGKCQFVSYRCNGFQINNF